MKNIALAAAVILMAQLSFAQQLSGRVVDAKTNEGIPFASLFITGVQTGTRTDSTGAFMFQASLPGEVTIRVSSSLYESRLITIPSDTNIIIALEESHLEVDEVVLIMPSGVMQRDNTVRVERLDLKDLNAIPASNLAEAVANLNGVQQASMGAGIAKPVIRGMQGIRVLTVLNGLRIQNQQWGGDHGLGISQLGLGAVEVIKGPSSLLYGADAFGGVLYLVDEKFARENAYELTFQSKLQSVNVGSTNSLMFKISKKNIRFNVGGLYSDFADFQLPNGRYLENTRYLDHGLKARLGLNKENWSMQARYMYSYGRIGIPGGHHEEEEEEEEEEHLEELMIDVPSRNQIAPAQRIQNHFASLTNQFYFNNSDLNVLLGYTRNELAEFEDELDTPALQMNLSNALYNAKWTTRIKNRWKIVAGLQGMIQQNTNTPGLEEELIPNYTQHDNGLYGIAYWSNSSKFSMQFGGRYDVRKLTASDYERIFVSPNFSVGTRWNIGLSSRYDNILRFNISSGFRAPHVSELLVEGEHHGALRYEVGNPDLKAERATQFDLDYEFKTDHISFVINPFYNYIQNYIQIEAQDSLVDDLQLYNFDQEDQVSLYGVDFGIHYHPHFAHWLHIESSYSLVQGEAFGGKAISLMPQPRVNNLVKLSFNMKGKFQIQEVVFQHQYFFEQTRIAEFETGTADYNMVNIGMNMKWNLKYPIEIGVGAKNLLNEAYVNHLSRLKNIGVNDMGRNLYVNLRYSITGKLKNKPKFI